jgi:hypothetical protein
MYIHYFHKNKCNLYARWKNSILTLELSRQGFLLLLALVCRLASIIQLQLCTMEHKDCHAHHNHNC